MKFVKVNVALTKIPRGGTHYNYPDGYDAEKIKVVAYEDVSAKLKYCYGAVDDADLAQFVASDDVEEITEAEITAAGVKAHPRKMFVADEDKFLRALKKLEPDLGGVAESKEFNLEDYT